MNNSRQWNASGFGGFGNQNNQANQGSTGNAGFMSGMGSQNPMGGNMGMGGNSSQINPAMFQPRKWFYYDSIYLIKKYLKWTFLWSIRITNYKWEEDNIWKRNK